MEPERRLDIGEGRDDHPQDALCGVERENATMTGDQPPHHLRLARRPECGTHLRRSLDRDETADDLAALDQEAVHGLVDAVDLGAERRQRWFRTGHGDSLPRGCPSHGTL